MHILHVLYRILYIMYCIIHVHSQFISLKELGLRPPLTALPCGLLYMSTPGLETALGRQSVWDPPSLLSPQHWSPPG